MTIADIRALLERAVRGHSCDVVVKVCDAESVEAGRVARWLLDGNLIRGSGYLCKVGLTLCNAIHVSGITPLGRRLLTSLQASDALPEVTRERDEARAAVRYLAQTLCDNGHPCVFDSVGGWVEIAYTTTGATVPDAQE
jgi:hypothetical protein